MTLYTALMRTQFSENGWVIVFPNGEEGEYDFLEQALGCLMMEHPEMLTAEVKCMHRFESKYGDYFKLELDYGKDYRGDFRSLLCGMKSENPSIKEVIECLELENKMADDLTLGDVNRIADIAGVMGNDVLEYLGF